MSIPFYSLMRSKIGSISVVCVLITSLIFSAQKIKEEELPPNYREFLKLTRYIILPQEEEVFMQLTNNRDRDIFIETFWKQRDPTAGTPENEYKEEHIKRFRYANEHLGRGTPKEGWMTDMGKIYIILGPPASVESFEATQGLYPVRVWYYYGDREKGLPAHFGIVFFQRHGAGEFKLYDPVSDGPGSLLEQVRVTDPLEYKELYEMIFELAPTLADVSLSMVIGEPPINYQPSTMNAIILADIYESPKKEVNTTYATHFLDYKGMVSTEYMTNYIESNAQVDLIQDSLIKMNFLHFSMAPLHLTVEYYEPKDQYYCNFELNVSLKEDEKTIYQYTKNFPMYFDKDRYDFIKQNGVALEDSFPVAEGVYELTILLQNSVGKEFSVFEQNLVVPDNSEYPRIAGPYLGYKFENYRGSVHLPFKILDKKLVVDPKNTFSTSDEIILLFNVLNVSDGLWNGGRIEARISPVGEKGISKKTLSLNLKSFPLRRIMSISQSLRAGEFSPDYYELKLVLFDEKDEILDEKKGNFIISPVKGVSHPVIHAKGLSHADSYMYYGALASQYEKKGKYNEAEENYAKAFSLKPENKIGLIEYANFLFKINKFGKVLELADLLKEDEQLRFEYLLLKGKAHMGLSAYSQAIDNLLEANKIYDSHVGLLNALGFCYYRIGNSEEALSVLNSSLRLDPSQEEVKKLIGLVKKK
jgi:GWxTD domain-containing protein